MKRRNRKPHASRRKCRASHTSHAPKQNIRRPSRPAKTRAVRRPEHQRSPTWSRPRGICRCSNFFLNGRTPVSCSNVVISAPRLIDLYQTSTKSGAVFAGGIAAHANSLFLAVKSWSNERPGRLIARFAAGIDGCIPEARGAADGYDPKGDRQSHQHCVPAKACPRRRRRAAFR